MPGYAPAPGQPYAPGFPPGYAMAGQPAQPPAKKNPLLFIIIGVVVVALIAVLVFVFANHGSKPSNGLNSPGSGDATTETKTPDGAVQGYLEAVAAGNSAAALAFAVAPPTDTTFLTDAVLSASLAINPITNITVTPADMYSGMTTAYVAASYSIGTDIVDTQYSVVKNGNDWLLKNVTQQVMFTYSYVPDIGMAVNGVEIDPASTDNVDLFPGTYQYTSTNPLLTFSNPQFIVESPDGYNSVSTDLALSKDAQPKLAAAAQKVFNACLKEQKLITSCGFGFKGLAGGAKANLSTLKWSVTSGTKDFTKLAFTYYGYSDATSATASLNLKIGVTVKDTKGRSYKDSVSIYQLKIDFTDPEKMVVTFPY